MILPLIQQLPVSILVMLVFDIATDSEIQHTYASIVPLFIFLILLYICVSLNTACD